MRERYCFAFTNKETLSESNTGITLNRIEGMITFVDLTANQGRSAMNDSSLGLSNEIFENIQHVLNVR